MGFWRTTGTLELQNEILDLRKRVRVLATIIRVQQHNEVMPHSAFHGQTPDEIYFGMLDDVPEQLAAARAKAREARLHANRNLSCEACRSEHAPG